MTRRRGGGVCPVCRKTYTGLTVHLLRGHGIMNVAERSILIKMATGRISVRKEPCPVTGCPYRSETCDRHILTQHREMSHGERRRTLALLKERTALALLRSLRASSPVPPLASALDVTPGTSRTDAKGCAGCQRLLQENDQLRCDLGKLRASYRSLTERYNLPAGEQGLGSDMADLPSAGGDEGASTSVRDSQAAGQESGPSHAEPSPAAPSGETRLHGYQRPLEGGCPSALPSSPPLNLHLSTSSSSFSDEDIGIPVKESGSSAVEKRKSARRLTRSKRRKVVVDLESDSD